LGKVNAAGVVNSTNPDTTGLEQKIRELESQLQIAKEENTQLKLQISTNSNNNGGNTQRRMNKKQISPMEAFSIEGRNPTIPLDELVDSANADKVTCKEGQILVQDTVRDPSLLWEGGRKIPRIIHVTSLSRCNADIMAKNIDDWRFEGYSLFLHDDPAVKRLHKVLACLPNKGAIMADIWRILVLWEYGGIYTDMDTGVKPDMFNGTSITPDMDGFFVMSPLSIPTQWFMSVSPRHPLMYFAMHRIIVNLISLKDIGDFPVVFTTGPAVIGDAFRVFVNQTKRKHFTPGTYYGTNGRSITIWGVAKPMVHFVRSVVSDLKEKNKVYQQTGMTHISKMGLRKKRLGSCWVRLLKYEEAKNVTYSYDWKTIDQD